MTREDFASSFWEDYVYLKFTANKFLIKCLNCRYFSRGHTKPTGNKTKENKQKTLAIEALGLVAQMYIYYIYILLYMKTVVEEVLKCHNTNFEM